MCSYFDPNKFNGYCNAFFTIQTEFTQATYCRKNDETWKNCPVYVQQKKEDLQQYGKNS